MCVWGRVGVFAKEALYFYFVVPGNLLSNVIVCDAVIRNMKIENEEGF